MSVSMAQKNGTFFYGNTATAHILLRSQDEMEPVSVHCCLVGPHLTCADGKVYHESGNQYGPFASAFLLNDRASTSAYPFTKLVYRLIDGYRQTLIIYAEDVDNMRRLCMGRDPTRGGLLGNLFSLIFCILKTVNKRAQIQMSCVDLDHGSNAPSDQFLDANPHAPKETFYVKGRPFTRTRVSVWSQHDASQLLDMIATVPVRGRSSSPIRPGIGSPTRTSGEAAIRILRISAKTDFHGVLTIAMVSMQGQETMAFNRLMLRLSKPAPSVKRCSLVNQVTTEIIQENPLCTVVFVIDQNPLDTLAVAQQCSASSCRLDTRNPLASQSMEDRLQFLRYAMRMPMKKTKDEKSDTPQSYRALQIAPERPDFTLNGGAVAKEAAVESRIQWLRTMIDLRMEHQAILRNDIESLKRCDLEVSRLSNSKEERFRNSSPQCVNGGSPTGSPRQQAHCIGSTTEGAQGNTQVLDDVPTALRWLREMAVPGTQGTDKENKPITISGSCAKTFLRALCYPIDLNIPAEILNKLFCPSLTSATVFPDMDLARVMIMLRKHDLNEVILVKPSVEMIEAVRTAMGTVKRLILSTGALFPELCSVLSQSHQNGSWIDELCIDRMDNLLEVFSALAGVGIRSLQFRHSLDDESGHVLASWLPVFEDLQILDVAVNSFGQAVVQDLLQVVPQCTGLKAVYLWIPKRTEWNAKMEEAWTSTKQQCPHVHIGTMEKTG